MFMQLDSLKYLKSCIKSYGANRMSKHAGALWLSLKDAIFHFPLKNSSILSLKTVPEDSQSSQIAEEALACLRAAISLFSHSGNESFENLIINDEDLEMGYDCMSEESQQKILAVGIILSEMVKASSSCCDKVMKKYLPWLMNTLGINGNDSLSSIKMEYNDKLNFGALYLAVELLSSCRELTITALHMEWWSLLQKLSVSFVQSFGLLLRSCISAEIGTNMHLREAALLGNCLLNTLFLTFICFS